MAHLFHADIVSVPAVAVCADGDAEVEFVVYGVGFGYADVFGDAACAQGGAGDAEVERVGGGDCADVACAG